jgi:signal transduction histidine kinase
MGNLEAAQKLRQLADTQASLRRLAVLIASGAAPETVFAAVTKEARRHFGGGTARTIRYELDGSATLVANEGAVGPHVRVGERWERYPATGLTATVRRTGRAARVDDYRELTGGEPYWREGLRSAVGMPVHVNGRLWGMIAVGSGGGPLPPDTEQRMTEFTELLATAIASAQSRAELIASRARIVAAADEARRRLERNLHDGAQQRAVSLGLYLRLAAEAVPPELCELKEQLSRIQTGLTGLAEELREISHGIHPAILSTGGLRPALKTLARRSMIPVTLDVGVQQRLPESVEVATYYVVAEALTNTAKHAEASEVTVRVNADAENLRLLVRDDGVGGADFGKGTGLIGLKDRVEALGGQLQISSSAGNGTTLHATIPLNRP